MLALTAIAATVDGSSVHAAHSTAAAIQATTRPEAAVLALTLEDYPAWRQKASGRGSEEKYRISFVKGIRVHGRPLFRRRVLPWHYFFETRINLFEVARNSVHLFRYASRLSN